MPNTLRELIGLVLTKSFPCRSTFLSSQGVVEGWCNCFVLLALIPSKSLGSCVWILAKVSTPCNIQASL